MAEVRVCLLRGADEFVLKTCKRYFLKSRIQYGRRPTHAACLSFGFLLDDKLNVGLYGAENAASRRNTGTSQDTYARVNLPFDSEPGANKHQQIYESPCYHGHSTCVVSSQNRVQAFPRKLASYQSNVKVWRIWSSSLQSLRIFGKVHPCSGQFRAYSGNGAGTEPLYSTKTGYYEILEVPLTATHAQIKTAYFKQSFIYHPDRNAGSDDATARFSAINEAYTVLGNKGLRKKYDRGILTSSDLTSARRPSGKDTTGGSSARHQSKRSVANIIQSREIFDFDLFLKSHYRDQLQKQRDTQVRKEELQKNKEENKNETLDLLMDLGVLMLSVMSIGLLLSFSKP